jgi:pimeloyl-ACP methyl ester carboxylesterase
MQRRLIAAILCCAALPVTSAQSQLPDITGEWDGILLGKLHLIVKLEKGPDGSLKGGLQSPDQTPDTIPIATVKLDAAKTVHLDLNSLDAVFEGHLTDDFTEIHGAWQQGGHSFPLILRRPGAAPKTTLHALTRGRVPLEPCRGADGNTEGLCGTYQVFENRETRAGRKIALHMMLLPAEAAKPQGDPVFMLAGGPGQSAVDAYAALGFTAKLRAQRDIVLVDQRGTGKSGPLTCALGDLQDAQTVVASLFPPEALKSCRAQLETHADLTQYTTSIAADDLNEVRLALGYGKIDLLGGSYGSLAAQVYLRRHPDTVRLMVLSQVVPPGYKLGLTFAKTIQASIERLFSDCAADAACSKAFPDLRTEYRTILERLNQASAKFEFYNVQAKQRQTVTLARGMFVANLRPILYIPELAAAVPYILHQAFEDHWDSYARAAFAANSGIFSQIARGLSFSVLCAEDVPFISDAEARRETEGTDLGSFLIPIYQAACTTWPRGEVPDDFFAPVKSDIPVLMISGAGDPATPPSTAVEAARSLPNSKLVTIEHGTHMTDSPCIDAMIAQFVAQGSAAGLDTSCVAQIKSPPFLTPGTNSIR